MFVTSLLSTLPFFNFCFLCCELGCSHKGAVAVRQPYIRVVGLEETNEANSRGPANFTVDEVISKLSVARSD